tara:strand:+ start:12891 stop:13460 length:570 start_codon:yes stop_codon:yes gene_type:complete
MSTIKTTNITHGSNSGTANMVLASDGSVTFASAVALFSSYAVICDQKTADTDGGTFDSGDWRDRDLNTEIIDHDSIVSISSTDKTFTLGAGTYFIKWFAPAFRCACHKSRLYDVTGTAVVQEGRTAFADSGSDGDQTDSNGYARVTIGSDNVYKIQHKCQSDRATIGFGNADNMGDAERYTVVEIWKEA